MLTDDAAMRDIVLGEGGLANVLQPGAAHVAMGAVLSELAAEMEAKHGARGQRYLSAVFGPPEAAAAGAL